MAFFIGVFRVFESFVHFISLRCNTPNIWKCDEQKPTKGPTDLDLDPSHPH